MFSQVYVVKWLSYIEYIIIIIIIIIILLLLLLLLLKMFKEGSPSAVAGFQGALYLNAKYNDKPNNLIAISI